ncbi:MAG: hypothetical protein BAJALOKI3v1_300027 [Promethearchaeota archaeon]|nr:MAG: hypothetical protein BAJALOKI3v1_300027 [Candidatus Lokiarchaeota archaeon]
MKEINSSVKGLIEGEKLVILVGAGCSVERPSNLPMAKTMIDAIIEFTCAEGEIEQLKDLSYLKFEQLLEIIRNHIDPELKICNYYALCDIPNIYHLFLSKMLQAGHFVITPNFDCLIEYNLKELGVPSDKIIPVITKKDYEKARDPIKLCKNDKKAVFKLHGSSKNVITQEDTHNSLIDTIKRIGTLKEQNEEVQLEPYKYRLFEKVSKNRILLVMGYSACNDLDILPLIKEIKSFKSLIWINQNEDAGEKERVFEIGEDLTEINELSDEIYQSLYDLHRTSNSKRIYLIEANTSQLISDFLTKESSLTSKTFLVSPNQWFLENLTPPDEFQKYAIAGEIYYVLNKFNDSERCLGIIQSLAEKREEILWKLYAQYNFGKIKYMLGEGEQALKYYQEALNIAQEYGDIPKQINILNRIAQTYDRLENYSNAIETYEKALKLYEEMRDPSGKMSTFKKIGYIFRLIGNYQNALKNYEKAFKIAKKFKDQYEIGNLLSNLGRILFFLGNYDKSIQKYQESTKVFGKLDYSSEKASVLTNLGQVYEACGRYMDAVNACKEAILIFDDLGDLSGKASQYNNIGLVYFRQSDYENALNYYNKALNIVKDLGDISRQGTYLNNIGLVYYSWGDYGNAVNHYEKAVEIAQSTGDIIGEISCLNNMAIIYKLQGLLKEALIKYEKAFEIVNELGDLQGKVTLLNNIGQIYNDQGDFENALKNYTEALEISDYLGDISKKGACLSNLGLIYYREKKYDEALNNFKEALKIDEILGDRSAIATDYGHIGLINYDFGKYDEALHNYKMALEIDDQLGDLYSKANHLNNIGLIYFEQKKLVDSLNSLENALTIFRDLGLENAPKTQTLKRNIENVKDSIKS